MPLGAPTYSKSELSHERQVDGGVFVVLARVGFVRRFRHWEEVRRVQEARELFVLKVESNVEWGVVVLVKGEDAREGKKAGKNYGKQGSETEDTCVGGLTRGLCKSYYSIYQMKPTL